MIGRRYGSKFVVSSFICVNIIILQTDYVILNIGVIVSFTLFGFSQNFAWAGDCWMELLVYQRHTFQRFGCITISHPLFTCFAVDM